MEQISKKKRNIIIISCIIAGICLAGGVAAAVFAAQRNPLTKGLTNLAGEVTALEEELGKHFWADAINQIGSENIQAEYSVNIGGIPELQNITVGFDGRLQRSMEQQMLGAEFGVSVANAEIAEASLFGTADTLYLQVPSVWEGNVVFDAENISGQWNESAVKKELQLLAGSELGIGRRIDVELFQSFSVRVFSFADFVEENREALKALRKNMEVMKVEKAQKEGILSAEDAGSLEDYIVEDADGAQIETTCYLVVLPEKELREVFEIFAGDVRLGVYLDAQKRIVRVCTLPGEVLETESVEGEFAVNLTGKEATLDRLEMHYSISRDGLSFLSDITGMAGDTVIERDKEKTGSRKIECESTLTEEENVWEFSLEGNIQGEKLETGEKLSLEAENFVLRRQRNVVCRASGRVVFAPLAEEMQIQTGKEYRIGEMNELETALFLAECGKNVYSNYSGYLKMMQ